MSSRDDKRKSSSASSTPPNRDTQKKALSKDQLENIYSNLDTHKTTILKWQANFEPETTKLLKHAKHSTNLTVLEIKGNALTPKHTGELYELIDQGRKLACLRIKGHKLDGQAFSRMKNILTV